VRKRTRLRCCWPRRWDGTHFVIASRFTRPTPTSGPSIRRALRATPTARCSLCRPNSSSSIFRRRTTVSCSTRTCAAQSFSDATT
jgi:hypothetical protein